MKNFIYTLIYLFLFSAVLTAQDGGKSYVPDLSTAPEAGYPQQKVQDLSDHFLLDKQLKTAIESGNVELESQIRAQIDELYVGKIIKVENDDEDFPFLGAPELPDLTDWLPNDVQIYSGNIGSTTANHMRIDLKMGEDGNLYAALIRRPETGVNGRIDVFSSSDGGATWNYVSGAQNATAYFGQVSLAVELRSSETPPNLDSTRIFIFYSRSTNENFDDATIAFRSFLRDGSSSYGTTNILTPSSGNKLFFPCAITDGQYYSTATYIGVTCGEYSNDNTQGISLRYARTTNWGSSFVTETIVDGYPNWSDWFPVSSFKNQTSDSVYIAVERRFSGSASKIRIISTPWLPSSSFFRHTLVPSGTDEYTKPAITIVQDAASLDKRIVVAAIKNGQAVYHYSTTSGDSWTFDNSLSLSTETNVSYITLSSDSSKSDNAYVVAAYQKGNGDSIVVRRGFPGSLGTRVHKPNEFRSSIYNAPKVAIYNTGSEKYSALAYTGIAAAYTNNLYFNQENLPTSVRQIGNLVPEEFSLEQNYPNPFNPGTTIRFSLPNETHISLKIFNSIGQEISSIYNGVLSAGNHQIDFNGSELSSGIYFYQISAGSFTSTKKMILMK